MSNNHAKGLSLYEAINTHPGYHQDNKQSNFPDRPYYYEKHELGSGPHLATTSNRYESGYECYFCGGEMPEPVCVERILVHLLSREWWRGVKPQFDALMEKLSD